MSKKNIKIFEQKQVRTLWDEEKEKWYLSIVDVIAVLTDSVDPNAYWRKLKQRLKEEGNETVTNCHGLKMTARMNMTSLTSASSPSGVLSQVVRELFCDMNQFASLGRAEYEN